MEPEKIEPGMANALGKKGAPSIPLQKFVHEGRTVYEWEQTIDEVKIYLHPPKGVTRRMLDIDIAERFIFVGIKGNPPFLHQQFYGQIKLDESFWMLDDGVIEISLQKQKKGEPWSAVFVGHGQMNPLVEQQLSKKLLLERFAEENPGFDFSNAEFSGNAPDPRKFMGGIRHTR
eukprot:INCI5298.2.p1 GENE.INCI5298.2~~INCI5298.2.p1  ORF type:complete len:174 (+),score=39.99 INCI5298.2:102-623(+)